MEKCSVENGVYSNYCQVYFKDGRIREEYEMENGMVNGEYKMYFGNGNIARSGLQKSGHYYRENYEYFERDSGKIQTWTYFVLVDSVSRISEKIQYDEAGNIIYESPSVTVEDYHVSGDTLQVRLTFSTKKKGDWVHFIIGDFNEHFQPVSSRIDTIRADKSNSIVFRASLSDSQIIRGIVWNDIIVGREDDLIKTESEVYYFEKEVK